MSVQSSCARSAHAVQKVPLAQWAHRYGNTEGLLRDKAGGLAKQPLGQRGCIASAVEVVQLAKDEEAIGPLTAADCRAVGSLASHKAQGSTAHGRTRPSHKRSP
uniref:Uncharacterized protein n=1 Tax=Eutreptiella gymnastica TaxID=73025 RepID=A0A7S1IPN9_9EUGL